MSPRPLDFPRMRRPTRSSAIRAHEITRAAGLTTPQEYVTVVAGWQSVRWFVGGGRQTIDIMTPGSYELAGACALLLRTIRIKHYGSATRKEG